MKDEGTAKAVTDNW